MSQLGWRYVVATPDEPEAPRIVSERSLTVTDERPGVKVARLLSLPRLPASRSDRALDGETGRACPGSVAVSAVALDPKFGFCAPWEPIPSLTWCVVVAGRVRVLVDSASGEEVVLEPGEVLVDEGGHTTMEA